MDLEQDLLTGLVCLLPFTFNGSKARSLDLPHQGQTQESSFQVQTAVNCTLLTEVPVNKEFSN